MLAYMTENKTEELPPEEWMEMILTRDFSSFQPTMEEAEAEDRQASAQNLEEYMKFLDFFDFYTHSMLPAVAGAKRWDDQHKFVLPISTAKMEVEGTARITPSHEALVGLLYLNGRQKWMAMQKWYNTNPAKGSKVPQWSNKKPLENVEFKTPYSDQFAGQNPLGGWKRQGRVLFGTFGIKVRDMRRNPAAAARCLQLETESIARLVQKHNYSAEPATKKRKYEDITPEAILEDADKLEWIDMDDDE
jgi:hypothetical protein